jgi:hypothetical protein
LGVRAAVRDAEEELLIEMENKELEERNSKHIMLKFDVTKK